MFQKDVPALCGYASSPDAAIGVCDSPAVYRPREPRAGELFALVEDNFDELERVWDERYERTRLHDSFSKIFRRRPAHNC
jgi:hypothetical protein